MTEAVMKYAFAPVGGLFSGFNSFFLSVEKQGQHLSFLEWVTMNKQSI